MYRIIERSTVSDLVNEVSRYVGQGWEPIGAPFYLPDGWWRQAVWTKDTHSWPGA